MTFKIDISVLSFVFEDDIWTDFQKQGMLILEKSF